MPEQKPARRFGSAPVAPFSSAEIGWTVLEFDIARALERAPSDFYREDRARLGSVPPTPRIARGGLSGWQRRRLIDFVEAHLGEELRLAAMAAVVDLSPYYFAHAFKQSFGVPPHRYHMLRRVERAKALLAEPAASVTTIALQLGFAETSSFSATFRRLAGMSPSDFRRGER
jgi:AraC-like DNA-binding protein